MTRTRLTPWAPLAILLGMAVGRVGALPPKDAPPDSEVGFLEDGPIYEIDPWAMSPEGTLNGITARIPYLADLGVKTLYIMPLFKHEPFIPYRVWDFFQLDPGFGTDDDLRRLVKTAHDHGLHVLVDFTVSHTPPPEDWAIFPNDEEIEQIRRSGAEERLRQALARRKIIDDARAKGLTRMQKFDLTYAPLGLSPDVACELVPWKAPFYDAHPEFIRHDKDGNPLRCWPVWFWGLAPNYDSVPYQNYMADVAEFWLRKYGIDGFRIDAPQDNWDPKVFPEARDASELLRKVKAAMEKVNPEAVMFCERMAPNYGASPGQKNQPVFDEMAEASYQDHILQILCYTFLQSQKWAKKDPVAPKAQDIAGWLSIWPVTYGRGRVHVLETHDFERIATIAPEFVEPLAVLQFTLPGIPMVFCGQEIGETDKYLVHWDQGNEELLELYKKLCRLHSGEPVLRLGSFHPLEGPEGTTVYARSHDGSHVVAALNWGDEMAQVSLDLAEVASGASRLTVTEPLASDPAERSAEPDERVTFDLPPRGYRLLRIREASER